MWIFLLLQIYNVPVVFSKSSTSDHYNMMPSLIFFLCVLVKAIDFQVFLFCSLNSLTFRHISHKFDQRVVCNKHYAIFQNCWLFLLGPRLITLALYFSRTCSYSGNTSYPCTDRVLADPQDRFLRHPSGSSVLRGNRCDAQSKYLKCFPKPKAN